MNCPTFPCKKAIGPNANIVAVVAVSIDNSTLIIHLLHSLEIYNGILIKHWNSNPSLLNSLIVLLSLISRLQLLNTTEL